MRLFLSYFIAFFSLPSFASGIDYFSFSFENDVFYREDGGYSNGLMVNWGYYNVDALSKASMPSWLASLSQQTYLPYLKDRDYAISYTFGHFLQTAINIKEMDLIETDAPYVGLLAWEANIVAANDHVVDDLSLTLGIVGPVSGAEYMQKSIHDLIGVNKPMGWDNQIDNELVFRVQAKRVWRSLVLPVGATEVDVITGVNAGVGNLLSDVNIGVGFRWGQKLHSSFSSSSPFVVQKLNGLTPSPKGWYVFANLSGSYVLNDIFINGNTFKNSHSVDLIHWQAGAAIGAQLNLYNWNFIYTMIYTTDQYQTQSEETRFGSISVTYHF